MKKITLLMLIVFTISLHGQNKLLSSIYQYYDGSSWKTSSGTNYEYDSNNNLITETDLDLNSGVWKNNYKTIYTYNASNKVTEEVYQNWNTTTNKFENSDKTTNTYINGMLTEILYTNWSSPNWIFSEKTTITYNGNNSPDSAITYKWDGTKWVNEYNSQLTYNLNNKLIQSLDDNWVNAQWVSDTRTTLTYDANNKIIMNKEEQWDGSNWSESYRTEYELDVVGSRIRETEFNGSNSYKDENAYDTSSLMTSFTNPFKDKTGLDYLFEDFPYINKLLATTNFNYDTSTNSYEMNGRTTYNYNSSITLDVEKFEITNDNLLVFPNPTKDYLSIQDMLNTDVSMIIVTDLSGKTVQQYDNKKNQIDVQNLSKGIYLLQVLAGDKKWNTKFIKE